MNVTSNTPGIVTIEIDHAAPSSGPEWGIWARCPVCGVRFWRYAKPGEPFPSVVACPVFGCDGEVHAGMKEIP